MMPWWVIPLIFGPVFLLVRYAKRHPESRWIRPFFNPFGATTDLTGSSRYAARSSAAAYAVWGAAMLFISLVISYLVDAKIIQFEEFVTLSVWFCSFLVGVTCLVAAAILWLRSRTRD
jgi:hypothetical protein